MSKQILIKPIVNKSNNQINFYLKKSSLPKKMKERLPQLKSIKLNPDDFEWDEKW